MRKGLQETDVFRECATRELDCIARFSDARSLGAHQVLFWQGEPCASLYHLQVGSMKLVRSEARRETVVDFVRPGQLFYEPALLNGNGYPLTAQALEDVEVTVIRAQPLLRLMQAHPKLLWAFTGVVSRRATTLVCRLSRLTSLSAEQRAAQYLLEHCGPDSPSPFYRDGARAPRQTDLARMLAISPETVSRLLAKFRRRGWIAHGQEGLAVTDPEGLRGALEGDGETRAAQRQPSASSAGSVTTSW